MIASVQPPEGFRSLEMGQSFLETNWGPDITDAQLPSFKTFTTAAAQRELDGKRAIELAQTNLALELGGKASPEVLAARTRELVEAEKALVVEQVATVTGLLGLMNAEQMETRLKMGAPPVLGDLIYAHPRTGAANPFARVETEALTDEEVQQALVAKLEVHARFLAYQKDMGTAMARLAEVDLRLPSWNEKYVSVAGAAVDSWAIYREFAVTKFTEFARGLPTGRRTRFLLDETFLNALKPSEARGSSTGNMIPANPNEEGIDLGATGGPGGGPGAGMGGPPGGPPGGGPGGGGMGGGMGGPPGGGGPGNGPGGVEMGSSSGSPPTAGGPPPGPAGGGGPR